MASSPYLKVYNGNEYVACCKYAEDAAAIVASYGDGTTIRYGHPKRYIVWTEGAENQPAGESYDYVRQVVHARIP